MDNSWLHSSGISFKVIKNTDTSYFMSAWETVQNIGRKKEFKISSRIRRGNSFKLLIKHTACMFYYQNQVCNSSQIGELRFIYSISEKLICVFQL